ncbi:TRM11 family methyltransferase [Agaribacterium sp. ZY112]|uniref:TRM11 family SAM-dependent methyltransferase n=1 Tax=Agaribacterium sp. ZY112 TaxID=3233574 RepID=UPI0035245D24
MNRLALQISPEAKQAYFANYLQVAERELKQLLGEGLSYKLWQCASLEFFIISAEEGLDLQRLKRLSFVQGLYELVGEALIPLAQDDGFLLHDDFVFGSKYKGKTNERLTQLLINVALAELDYQSGQKLKLLDPMCGRGTTLLWAMRYGLNAKGIEQDVKALEDVRRNVKKWSKLHRQKHKLSEGFVNQKNKKNTGKFLEFSAHDSSARLIIGDSADALQLLSQEKFDLLVSDIPYGVQHLSSDGSRNPIDVLEKCADVWRQCMKKNAVLVLSFNALNPKRSLLKTVFEHAGFELKEFDVAHRMSESILRDVCMFRLK